MRQRNDTDLDLIVHTDPPQVLPPGGEIDHDTPVIGLTVLDEADVPGEAATDDPASAAQPKKSAAKTSAKEATTA